MATEGVQLTFEEAALKKIGMYTYGTRASATSAPVHLIETTWIAWPQRLSPRR